jgi:hypothetical protein
MCLTYADTKQLNVAQTRGFALHSPSMFLDELITISPYNGANTIYEVLMSAGRAVNITLSDNVKDQMLVT